MCKCEIKGFTQKKMLIQPFPDNRRSKVLHSRAEEDEVGPKQIVCYLV